ncbi:MAG: hypothetical protein HQM15_11775 [Deltaproteobacteria bacterium]|nr:hypothetical protein [Deltaproteobacteria bacterium]
MDEKSKSLGRPPTLVLLDIHTKNEMDNGLKTEFKDRSSIEYSKGVLNFIDALAMDIVKRELSLKEVSK